MSIGLHNFAAGGRPSERMREDLSNAFSFAEGEDEAAAADGLRAVVSPPPPLDFAEFQEESSNHRVLILRRGAVVAVTTLVSIGGALFLHSLFAGAFVLALLFGRTPAPGIGQGSGGDAASEGGSGFMVIDNQLPAASPSPGAMSSAAALLEKPAALPATPAAVPILPQSLPEMTAIARAADPVEKPTAAPLAMQMPDDFGTVRVTPPARPTESPAVPDTLTVAPPETAAASPPAKKMPSPSSVASAAGTGRAGGAGARAADIGDGDYGDEPVFSLVKGDGSGQGQGAGRGRGNDLDRGLSAAYSQAQLLSPLNFRVPYQYQLKPPSKDIILNVTVLPNGLPGDIAVAQSCGIPELDAAFKEYVAATGRFRPAFDRGKAVSSVEQIGQMFGNE